MSESPDTAPEPARAAPASLKGLAQGYQPSTFLERGAAVPFTTPQLAGARARPGERGGLELLVPNPSGGRGVYVLPWDGVQAMCRPTLHDRRLHEAVMALRGVTPAGIRAAARSVAAEGLAGRDAVDAAEAADAVDEEARLLANFGLLLELVRQVEAPGAAPPAADQPGQGGRELLAGLEARSRQVVATVAPKLGQKPERVASSLEELAGLFASLGIGRDTARARIPRSLLALAGLRTDMTQWAQDSPDTAPEATMIAAVIGLTLTCTRSVLDEARRMTANMPDLLRRWMLQPDDIANRIARPDWLLDGWERIGLLWQTAKDMPSRQGILAELVELVPVMPREVNDWVETKLDVAAEQQRHRRKVVLNEDWRTGATSIDLIERNEQLLALAE